MLDHRSFSVTTQDIYKNGKREGMKNRPNVHRFDYNFSKKYFISWNKRILYKSNSGCTPKTMYNVLLCTKNKASIGRFCASIKLRPWSFVRHFLVFCLLKTDAKKVVLYEALTFAIRHKFNLNSKTVCCSFYLEWINKASLNTIFIVLPKKPKDLFMWWRSNARYFSCSEL